MKRILLSLFMSTISILVTTQVPESFNYQAIPRNGSGGIYPDQGMNIRISIISGSPAGSPVYTETFGATTTSLGLLNLQVGRGTPVSGTFSTIDWGAGSYYLKVEIDATGGTSYVEKGTTQLLSVPYALNAKTAANYSETDPFFVAHPTSGITNPNINNWNTAYGWGNHSGLYHQNSWVPTWTDVTGKPTFSTVATSGSYNDLIDKPAIINSQWGTSGADIYYISGNVGIGALSPNRKLSVNGDLNLNAYLTGGRSALLCNGFEAIWFNGTYYSWGYGGTYNYFGDPITIGNVANPTGYALWVQGNAWSTGSFLSSDSRFKKDISKIENSLDKIMKIRGTSFEFRSDEFKGYQFAEGPQFGFIAQELENVFPEVVKTESNGYKSFNYSSMIPVLLEAIKEQQKQMEELKKEVALLRSN